MADKGKGKLSRAGATLGKSGGKKGGPARAAKLSKSERSAIARKGAKAKHRKK